MRLDRPFLIAASAAMAALFASATIAEAQTRAKKRTPEPRTITVQKRSFLDPGKVVPVGSESLYVQSGHYYSRSPDYYSTRSRFGAETLPGRFDVPQQPLFNF